MITSEQPREFILTLLWPALDHLQALTRWRMGQATIAEILATGDAFQAEVLSAIGENRVGFEDDPEVQAFLRLSAVVCAMKHEAAARATEPRPGTPTTDTETAPCPR